MKKLFVRILIVIVVVLLSGCSHLNNTRYLMCDDDIVTVYNWTHWASNKYLETYPRYEMPKVNFVDITEMEVVAKANGYRLPESPLGLYIAPTKTIYIVEQQDLCNQKAALSHEFVHYYQHMKYGWSNSIPIMMLAIREDDAYRIQYEHEREICGKKLPPYEYESDILLGLDK